VDAARERTDRENKAGNADSDGHRQEFCTRRRSPARHRRVGVPSPQLVLVTTVKPADQLPVASFRNDSTSWGPRYGAPAVTTLS
jgi:hypothetical protein